jgi:hypothetical protein
MTCIKCKNPVNADITHIKGSLCPVCASTIIEKRVRKSLRKNDWITPKDKVLVIDNNTIKAKIGIHILDSIFQKKHFKIDVKKGTIAKAKQLAKGYNKIIIPWNTDDEIEQYLAALFNAKKVPKTKYIKLLINISDEELEQYAKANNIKGKKKIKSALGKKIDALEKRYPGSKFGLLKSLEA